MFWIKDVDFKADNEDCNVNILKSKYTDLHIEDIFYIQQNIEYPPTLEKYVLVDKQKDYISCHNCNKDDAEFDCTKYKGIRILYQQRCRSCNKDNFTGSSMQYCSSCKKC